MKQIVLLLVLFTGTTAKLCAQAKSRTDQAFEVPPDIAFNRLFNVSLDNGNKMRIELSDITDLSRLQNIDSLLTVFLADMEGLKDSLSDPLSSKRIDHFTDAEGRKKIRLQQFLPPGNAYLLNTRGELASLRTEQDTIHIIGILVNPPPPREKISLTHPRYYHFTFFLNSISELNHYMGGTLSAKIATIQQHVNGRWPTVLGSGNHYMKADKNIVSNAPKGYTGGEKDFIAGWFAVDVKNYKQYFVPSFTVGTLLTLSNRDRNFKREIGLFWEPNFFFAKDNQNKLQTNRNDFLTLTLGQGGFNGHDSRNDFTWSSLFSLSYLIYRTGDFVDKNSFRFGAGKFQFRKTSIEPCMHFNNFFRGVTPAIRISQRF
jgi:hypothetical protein